MSSGLRDCLSLNKWSDADGVPLDEFLDDFPTVSREQAVAVLEIANKLLTSINIAKLYEAAA